MVRPKLVEEGVPIGHSIINTNTNTTTDLNEDFFVDGTTTTIGDMEDASLAACYSSNASSIAPSMNMSLPLSTLDTHSRLPSSLQRAAKNDSKNKHNRKTSHHMPTSVTSIQSRIVIGEEQEVLDHRFKHDASDESCTPMEVIHDCHDQIMVDGYPSTNPSQDSVSRHPIHQKQQQHQSHYDHAHHPRYKQKSVATTIPILTRTHIEIGSDNNRCIEKMEGVEDHSIKAPLIVIDGANIAFAYGEATTACTIDATNGTTNLYANDRSSKPMPDVRGLVVAENYFAGNQNDGCRVLIVLTQSWLRQQHHSDHSQQEVLQQLRQRNRLVTAPISDDDDAYALQIAQRENRYRYGTEHGCAYILSNDHFRDAQQRQPHLKRWLNQGHSNETGPGRISFAFADLGRLDDHGDPILDILPNPRHPLVAWIEQQQQQQQHYRNTMS